MANILFMGTPKFAVPILESLIQKYNVIGVVTQPDRPIGRKKILSISSVKEVAIKNNLSIYQPEKLVGSKELEEIMTLPIDLIVTAAYGQFLPEKLLNYPTFRSINVHASLLPKYRGGAPIQYAIMNDDKEIGVSIMYMEKKMDAGDILSQQSIPLLEEDNVATLFDKLSFVGRDLLLNTLPNVFNKKISPIPQNEKFVTFSPAITKEEEQIDFSKTARQIHNKVRAMNTWPGAYTLLNDARFKIWETAEIFEKHNSEVGVIIKVDKENLWISCGNQTVLSLKVVQPAGKSKMTIQQFLNGALNVIKVGDKLGE